MVPNSMATILVAAFLATIWPVARAPITPGDTSNFADRSVDGVSRAMQSLSTSNGAATHQPEYGQYGFHFPTNTEPYAHSVARPHAHATPHYDPSMHIWSDVPQEREFNQLDTLNVDELLARFEAAEQERRGSTYPSSSGHLRSTPMGPGQQQHLGSPAGVDWGAHDGRFGYHSTGTHQSMGAQGSLAPISSSSLFQQAGPSSLHGELLGGEAQSQGRRPAFSKEKRKRRKSERTDSGRQGQDDLANQRAASLGTDRAAIVNDDTSSRAANSPLTAYEQELLDRAIPLFTIAQMGPQPVITVLSTTSKEVPMEGYVRATEDQVRVIQEILTRRFEKYRKPSASAYPLRLEFESTRVPYKKGITEGLKTVKNKKERIEQGPFEKPRMEPRPGFKFRDEFALGDYLIYIHDRNYDFTHRVVAYPKAKLDEKTPVWNSEVPQTVFLGELSIREMQQPARPNVAHTDPR